MMMRGRQGVNGGVTPGVIPEHWPRRRAGYLAYQEGNFIHNGPLVTPPGQPPYSAVEAIPFSPEWAIPVAIAVGAVELAVGLLALRPHRSTG